MPVIILTIDGKEVYNSNISNNIEAKTQNDDSKVITEDMVEQVLNPQKDKEYYYFIGDKNEDGKRVYKQAKLIKITSMVEHDNYASRTIPTYVLEKDGNTIDKAGWDNTEISMLYRLKKPSGGRRKTQRKSRK